MCADDLKRGQLVGDVDRRQCNTSTGDNGDAIVVDDRSSTTLYKRRARFPLDRADLKRGDNWLRHQVTRATGVAGRCLLPP